MLQTLKLLQRLEALDIHPYLDDDKLRVRDTNKRLTDELRRQIRANKSGLLDLLAGKQNKSIERIYKLSPMQSGMLFHSQLAPNSGTYIEHSLFHLDDPTFDTSRFIQAIQTVIDHHDSLRAAFRSHHESESVQVIYERAMLPVTVLSLRDLSQRDAPQSVDEHQKHLFKLVEDDRLTDFDFSQAPLLRLTIIERQAGYDLLFTFHHILMDRWSLDLFWSEVVRAYAGLPLPQATPYQSYIHYLRQLPDDASFWQDYLSGFYAPTPLPAVTTSSNQPSGKTASITQMLPLETTLKLTSFAREQGLTMNVLFQAAWSVLLARYTRESDVLFGMVTSGRTASIKDIESIIGLFINTLPFRVKLSAELTGEALLQQVAQTQFELQQREHTPLVSVQQWSEVPAGTNLFDSLLLFQNTPQSASRDDAPRKRGDENSLNLRSGWVEPGDTGYPLVILVAPGESATLVISYDTARYDEQTVERLLTHWQQLVMGIVNHPLKPVLQLPMLTEAEYHQIVHQWNDTAVDFGAPQTIHALFEQQVERTPEAVALVFNDAQLTYRELNARANQLAHHLIDLGVQPDTLVAVAMERSIEMVVGLLAVLKASGAYVPIDPTYPKERIRYMLTDSAAPILLTQSHLGLLYDSGHVITVDRYEAQLALRSRKNPFTQTSPKDLAYCIYTSGSTGQPKGIAITHRNVANFLAAMQQRPGLTQDDRLLALTTISFDIAVLELYLPLVVGASVIMTSEDDTTDPSALIRLIQQHQITVAQATPATWSMLTSHQEWQSIPPLKVLCGGEAFPPKLAQQLLAHSQGVWNMYGPTEATVWASAKQLEKGLRRVTIAPPISNTTFYILDDGGGVIPIGVGGELHIGGIQVAKCYLNRPQLTAERFIEHPEFGRLYKTGDLCRWLPDGNIEFMGRTDFQVKIRGFRIELGEIENVLLSQDGVREAVVLAREDNLGDWEPSPWDKRLVAYFVGDADIDMLRQQLAQRLPDYMVPSAFVELPAMPLTPNGKLDRRALPAPTIQRNTDQTHRPRTLLEQQLVQVWEETLAVYPVGIHDNFFEIGGHSLLAVQLLAKLQNVLAHQMPLRTLFTNSTVAMMARAAKLQEAPTSPSSVVALQPRGTQPPFYCLPGAGGGILYLYQLAQAMGDDQPFVALESVGLDGKTPPFTTVESAAAYQVAQLLTHQPSGSYYLGGHSFGGFVAFEMALQLHKAGANVGAVVILDTGAPTGKPQPMEEVEIILLYERLFLEEYGLDPTLTKEQLTPLTSSERLSVFKKSLENAGFFPPNTPLSQIRGIINVVSADMQAGIYFPTEFSPLPIHLFVATDDERDEASPKLTLARTQTMIDGWSKYGKVTVHEVPGTHTTMMYEPHVQVLAQKLANCLK